MSRFFMGNTFLKWAGGKHWFVCKEQQRFPNEYNRYIEPFLGGSCFFSLTTTECFTKRYKF